MFAPTSLSIFRAATGQKMVREKEIFARLGKSPGGNLILSQGKLTF